MRWAGLRLAVTLLTAIPLRGRGPAPTRGSARTAMTWAPVIGLLLGGAAAGVIEFCTGVLQAGPLLAAVLAVAALAALTRGLHLDGLADLADGLGSRRPAAMALDIMQRSDIGPYGVATLVLTLLIQVTALATAQERGRGLVAITVAAVTGRLAMTWACRRTVPAARGSGLGALVAGTQHPAVPLALTAALLGGAAAAGWIFAAAAATGLVVSYVVTRLAVRRLGGITGDVLGALTEIATAACLIVTAIR
jgi:adenosylcobinamide-GDP ribazoletransferase